MKKIITSILSLLLAFLLFGCSTHKDNENSSQAAEDNLRTKEEIILFLNENDVSEFCYFNCNFELFFTPEQYVDLCKKFDNRFLLKAAISENLVVAMQDLSTYNKVEHKYVIMDTYGSIIKEYGNNCCVEDVTRIGEYAFIQTAEIPYKYDILNMKGSLVGSFETERSGLEYISNIGNNYHLFCSVQEGRVALYILSPTGTWTFLESPAQGDLSWSGILSGDLRMSEVGDNLFGIVYGTYPCYARYYNLNGECTIDLTSDIVNFEIITLGTFENGQAEIRFWGADNKIYDGIINKKGDFVSDPILSYNYEPAE